MNKLEIPFFNHPMLDNGTVALHRYLNRYRNNLPIHLQEYSCHFITRKKLLIESEQLFDLLEGIYYLMGKEIYDTYTAKQQNEAGNLYFIEEANELIFKTFPKMNTYGLTELLTNNAQGTTKLESNTRKIANIEKDDTVLADNIKTAYEKSNIKLLSKIYFNEPYTKITRLEKPEDAHFVHGKFQCCFTGNSIKKAVDTQNTSAFLSGIISFNSFLSNSDKKISWLAMYLSRFAAGNCLYVYENKMRDRLMVYLFCADNLEALSNLWWSNRIALLDIDTLRSSEYEFVRNFEVQSSFSAKHYDLQLTNDNLLGILYTLQKRAIKQPKLIDNDPLNNEEEIFPNYSMITMRADTFASTKRPNRTEYIDNVSPLLHFIQIVENEGLIWNVILDSLKIIKPSLVGNKKANRLQREFREMILGKIFKSLPIYNDMADFFIDCYAYALDGHNPFRSYIQLLNFTKLYENKRTMGESKEATRIAAVKLGEAIGEKVRDWKKGDSQPPDKVHNAKQGRKYILLLRKARTFDKFTDALARLQSRFQFEAHGNVLYGLNEDNFKEYRDFSIMAATNVLIKVLNKNKSDNE